ncbi:MAG: hypothetical protein KDB07_07025, partial [Planctomycetes bacterium]|nr:hypothetical protein [Planctomycetota bacterium]
EVAMALGVKHVIVVNWALQAEQADSTVTHKGGAGWQLWRYSFGDKIEGKAFPEVSAWPKENALKALQNDLASSLSAIAPQAKIEARMPSDDEFGQRLAGLKAMLLAGNFGDAAKEFDALNARFPSNPALIYMAYEYTRDTTQEGFQGATLQARASLHQRAVDAIYDAVAAKTRDLRMRTLMAAH